MILLLLLGLFFIFMVQFGQIVWKDDKENLSKTEMIYYGIFLILGGATISAGFIYLGGNYEKFF